MMRSVLVLALACPVVALAAPPRTEAVTDERAEAQSAAQRIGKRDARDRAPAREDRATKAEREYWRFVAEHEIDADLAYEDEDRR